MTQILLTTIMAILSQIQLDKEIREYAQTQLLLVFRLLSLFITALILQTVEQDLWALFMNMISSFKQALVLLEPQVIGFYQIMSGLFRIPCSKTQSDLNGSSDLKRRQTCFLFTTQRTLFSGIPRSPQNNLLKLTILRRQTTQVHKIRL